MKRLRRIIFNSLVVVSLLLFVAMAGVWVRSYWVGDTFRIGRGHGYFGAEAMRGRLVLYKVWISDELWDDRDLKGSIHPGPSYLRHRPRDPDQAIGTGVKVAWNVGGLRYVVSDGAWQIFVRVLIIPFWMIVVPLASFGLWGGLRFAAPRRRSSRRRRGECAKCGYDLRATPERCPECGAIAASEKA